VFRFALRFLGFLSWLPWAAGRGGFVCSCSESIKCFICVKKKKKKTSETLSNQVTKKRFKQTLKLTVNCSRYFEKVIIKK
jgi:hypothetical protein